MDEQRAVLLLMLLSLSAASSLPSNVALNKATFSSGQNNKSRSSSVVVDGDKSYSFTNPSTGRFCTQCFLSTPSDNPWWRVDLGGQFFITDINIYTGAANRLIGPFEILSKETSGNLNPADDYSQWNVIQNVSTLVSTYEYPLPTAVYAQHVAVMEKENPLNPKYKQSLVLTEVEVYGFTPAEFKPTNLQITSVTTDCVSFSWNSPHKNIGASYQYKCDSITWSTATTNTVAEVCGLSPTLSTECSVRVEDMTVTTVSTQLQCSDFAKTPQISFVTSAQMKVRESSRWRLPYLVTWSTVLTPVSCLHPSYPYRVEVSSTSDSPANSTTGYWLNEASYTVYGDIGDTITVTVRIHDTENNFSDPASTELEVNGELPPQKAPENFQLAAASSKCVKLSYGDVLHPNGPLDGLIYQYNCNSGGWKNIPDTKEVCGFTPNTLVNCDIRARRESNSAGNQNSDTATSSTTTCTAPLDSSSLLIGSPRSTTNSGRTRWEYTVLWQIPPTYQCDRTNLRYSFSVNREYKLTNSQDTSYKLYADGYVNINIVLYLTKDNAYYADTSDTIQTPIGLAPQIAPRNFELTAVSPYCVSLSYDPVEFANGPENGLVYQYNCISGGWRSIPTDKRVCAFTPNTQINCQVRAKRGSNSVGSQNSETDSGSVTTPCLPRPPPPTNLVFSSPVLEYNSYRTRWKYIVTWQEPNTYECLNEYYVRVDNNNQGSRQTSNSFTLYTDGGVDLTIYVWSVDRAGNYSSSPLIERFKTSSVDIPPQVAPRNFKLTAVSPYCVSLSYDPVLYPNGPESGLVYQMSCENRDWVDIPSNNKSCGYSPYQLVSCDIRATRVSNSPGTQYSQTATAVSVRTQCAAPSLPPDLSSYIRQYKYTPVGESEAKVRIYLNLLISDIAVNCESILSIKYKLKEDREYIWNRQYLLNLLPFTDYTIEVKVKNNANNKTTTSFTFRTITLEPYDAPIIVKSTSYNKTCVYLEWNEPNQPNGVITKYKHRYYIKGPRAPSWMELKQAPQINSFIACGFNFGDLVTYEIAGGTSAGFGQLATGDVRVTCGLPIIPEVQTSYMTQELLKPKHNMTLTWEEAESACDRILYYNLIVKHGEKTLSRDQYLDAQRKKREKVLEDLDPYTNYTIILVAVNNFLNQSIHKPQYILTPELAPYDGPGLSVEVNSSCVTLSLQSPMEPNGVILFYLYNCGYANTTVSEYKTENANEQSITMCGFPSAERIECRALATNTAGNSPVTAEFGYTEIAIVRQSDRAKLKVSKRSGRWLEITVYQVTLDNKEPHSYVFVVQKETSKNKRKKRSSVQLPPECDLDPDCYITAEIDSSLLDSDGYDFRVGDGKTYRGYYNAPLEPNQDYKIYEAVTVRMKDGSVLHKYYDDLITVHLDPVCGVNCIVAIAVSAFVLLVGFVLLVVLIKRKRNNSATEARKASAYQALELSERSKLMNDAEYATIPECSTDTAENKTPYEEVDTTSIPTNKLQEYIKDEKFIRRQFQRFGHLPQPVISVAELPTNKSKNRYRGVYSDTTSIPTNKIKEYIKDETFIRRQFQSFGNLPQPVMSVAELPSNKSKNRYRGTYPADKTRVKLQRQTSEHSDYINATYIENFFLKATSLFIATQGPMENTVDDFWLMIWQQGIQAIVMITNIIERRKVKCEQYWPQNLTTESSYDDITVCYVSYEEWADYVVRVFEVTKNGEKRRVRQYHYTAWPDHGVPDTMSPFISFYKKIKTETYQIDRPLLVHCSTGVGRTGIFIAMSNLLDQAHFHQHIDFYKCVTLMKECRSQIIQTEEEYIFLHHVVNEVLRTSIDICTPIELDRKLETLTPPDNTEYLSMDGEVVEEYEKMEEPVEEQILDVDKRQVKENIE